MLTFDAAPNYEDAGDSGTNNTYVVDVTATSGAGTRVMTATQTITVTVTDVGHGGAGQAGDADGVGGVGDQPEGELVGAVQRGSAHYALRRAAPDILAGGLVDGEECPVHRGGDREPVGEHVLRRAGAGDQRRGHGRLVGLGQRHDGRGGRRRQRGAGVRFLGGAPAWPRTTTAVVTVTGNGQPMRTTDVTGYEDYRRDGPERCSR